MTTTGRLSFIAPILALAAVTAATASEPMNAGDIEAALSGATLDGIYANGTYFTETYHDDYTIRYWDANGADSGRWSVRDGLFCTFYEAQEGACFMVKRDGDNCFSFFEMEEENSNTPKADWTSRGWNRDKPATCPSPPAVAI
jgi:hypothetical protein